MKKADKSKAKLALILGEDELEKDVVTIKFLREKKEQEVIALSKITDYLKKNIGLIGS